MGYIYFAGLTIYFLVQRLRARIYSFVWRVYADAQRRIWRIRRVCGLSFRAQMRNIVALPAPLALQVVCLCLENAAQLPKQKVPCVPHDYLFHTYARYLIYPIANCQMFSENMNKVNMLYLNNYGNRTKSSTGTRSRSIVGNSGDEGGDSRGLGDLASCAMSVNTVLSSGTAWLSSWLAEFEWCVGKLHSGRGPKRSHCCKCGSVANESFVSVVGESWKSVRANALRLGRCFE